jgi:hypothetical protein
MRIISEESDFVTREIVHAGPVPGHRPLSRPTDSVTEPMRQTANPRLAIRRIPKTIVDRSRPRLRSITLEARNKDSSQS